MTQEEFDSLLCSTGYLPPRTEAELDTFNELYKDQSSRLKDWHVDIDKITNN